MKRLELKILGRSFWWPKIINAFIRHPLKRPAGRWFAVGIVHVRYRGHKQLGAAALEFALVMPTVIALFCGIAAFGAALYAKQLLYDVAGETARACALKSFGSQDAVDNCVQNAGKFLSTAPVHSQICFGSTVQFSPASLTADSAGIQTNVPTIHGYPQKIMFLQVTASCKWNFAPGFAGLLGGMQAPSALSASASVPVLFDTSPL